MGSPNPARSFAAVLVLASVLALTMSGTGCAASSAIEIDKERGEVRFPCRFVNPTRLLEVFACHRTGPTHETVLEFDVSGPAIYRALLEIGCRPVSYWNGTSPDDFQKNQGDRILVLVRWEHAGEREEHAAEGMLTEGETGFPSPVRGFSFGARGAFKVAQANEEDGGAGKGQDAADESGEPEYSAEWKRLAADAKATGIPIGVEISLGALLRQTPPHTLLSHPTSSARMQRWMPEPYLDTRVVKEHRELVEKQVEATLILRRIRSEATLAEFARATAAKRSVEGADALYARVEPIAREIDALKGEYEALLGSLRGVIEKDTKPQGTGDDERRALAEKAKGLIQRGQWLCGRIEERYLSMYALEEELKASWVEKQKDMPFEVRDEALVHVRDGFRFEPIIAGKEVELAALDIEPVPGPPAEIGLRRKKISAEIEVIGFERAVAISKANVRDIAAKIADVKDSDAYVRRLFEEDLLRAKAAVDQYDARRRISWSEAEELSGLLDGSWDTIKGRVTKEREAARADLERAQLRDKLVTILEEIRWTEGEQESDDPVRRAEAKAKLEELQKKKAELEHHLQKN